MLVCTNVVAFQEPHTLYFDSLEAASSDFKHCNLQYLWPYFQLFIRGLSMLPNVEYAAFVEGRRTRRASKALANLFLIDMCFLMSVLVDGL